MQAVLDHTIPYVHMREAFGQKIGHFQASGVLWEMCCFTGFVLWARWVCAVGIHYPSPAK